MGKNHVNMIYAAFRMQWDLGQLVLTNDSASKGIVKTG